MKVTVKTQGFKELEQNLFKLKSATVKSAVRYGMREALEPMAREARGLTPVDNGTLRDSIDVSGMARPPMPKQSDLEMYMGPGRYPQAIMQEFGTYKEPAQPFMRPAWDAESEATLDRFSVFLWDRVTRAINRLKG